MPNAGPRAQKVIPTPDVSHVELQRDDLVLVCCDGVFEELSNEQVAKFIADQLAKQKGAGHDSDPAAVVQSLLHHSLASGSVDNMSAILLVPEEGSAYTRADEYAVGPFLEWVSDRAFVDAFITDARRHGHNVEELKKMVNAYNAKRSREKEKDTGSDADADADSDEDPAGAAGSASNDGHKHVINVPIR